MKVNNTTHVKLKAGDSKVFGTRCFTCWSSRREGTKASTRLLEKSGNFSVH